MDHVQTSDGPRARCAGGSRKRYNHAMQAPPASARADDDRLLRRGVHGAVLCALSVAVLWALTVPAYWPVDELSHVPYALAVVEGQPVTIHSPIRADGHPGMAERLAFERAAGHVDRQDVWTSNHPPLYFALAGLPLAVGEAVDAPGLGFLGARLVSALAGAAGVALTAALASLLLPGRRRVAVLAAAFAALTPALGHFSGLVFNDSLSFALCTGVLLCALLALRAGLWRWALAVAGAGTAAALTRASALPLVAFAAGACTIGAWFRGGTSPPRAGRWASTVAAGVLTAGLPAIGAGWFYRRNWLRYGDLTGGEALLEKFHREPNAALGDLLLSGRFYLGQWDRLLGDLSTGVWTRGWRIPVIRGIGLMIVIGLVLVAVRWARERGWATSQSAGGLTSWQRAGWTLSLAFGGSLLLATARFHADGGSAHARYLLPALAVLALLAALGLDELGRRARWGSLLPLGGMVVAGLGVWLQFLEVGSRMWSEDGRVYPLLRIGSGWADVAAAGALVLLGFGLLLVGWAVLRLPPGGATVSDTGPRAADQSTPSV